MTKQVIEFEVIDHGIEHEQYFQGCGVSFTKFEDCFTGIGSNASEALEDALDQAEQFGYDTSDIELDQTNDVPTETEGSEGLNYYFSVRVR